jgi:hypothetical protein
MTPVASTAAASRTGRVAVPRRVSGPVRRRAAPAARATLGPQLLRRAAELADARLLARLVRGRAWIAVIGVMLMGLVFVQVSMLRLNTGIGRDVATAASLERANQQLRNTVAGLGAGDRIASAAQKLGMVMPAAGPVHYLTAGAASADAAVRGISAPDPVTQQPASPSAVAPATTAPVTPAVTPVGGVATAAPVTPATTAPPVTPVTQQPPPVTQQPPATTAPPTAVAAATGGAAPGP